MIVLYFQCLNQSVPADLNTMSWKGLRITYNVTPEYYGQEIIKLVGYDSSGTYSDVVTVNLVIMKDTCLNEGVCASKSPFPTCKHISMHLQGKEL